MQIQTGRQAVHLPFSMRAHYHVHAAQYAGLSGGNSFSAFLVTHPYILEGLYPPCSWLQNMAMSGSMTVAFFGAKLLMVYGTGLWLVPYIDPAMVTLMVRGVTRAPLSLPTKWRSGPGLTRLHGDNIKVVPTATEAYECFIEILDVDNERE
eukprot:9471963-Pyramimonas_sp.AAC.2